MSVYKRQTKKGIRWGFDRRIKGIRLQTGAVFLKKSRAEEAEQEAVSRLLSQGTTPTFSHGTIQELTDARSAWAKIHRGDRHLEDHATVFKRVVEYFGADRRANEITADDAQSFLDSLAQDLISDGFGMWSVNKTIRIMQATYNHPWGRRRGKKRSFAENPWSECEFAAVEKRAKFIPTHRQIQQLRMAATEDERLLLEVMVETGARPIEARQIQWMHISEHSKTVSLFTRKKKDGSLTPRPVPLPDELYDRLQVWRKKHEDTVYVFQGEEGNYRSYRWCLNRQTELCQRSGVPYFGLHSYRHYHASKMAQDGFSLVDIQRRLGHEAATTTNIYLHSLGVVK